MSDKAGLQTMSRRKQSMKVRFEEHPCRLEQIHPVLHRDDYTVLETIHTWYSVREIKAVRRANREDLANFVASPSPSESSGSSPGTICTSEGLWDDSIEAVLHSSLSPFDGFNTTIRGLEVSTKMGSIRRRRHRVHGWCAVLREQLRQREMRAFASPKTRPPSTKQRTTPLAACGVGGFQFHDDDFPQKPFQNIDDPDAVAEVYAEISEPCHAIAHIMGVMDAQEALNCWESSGRCATKEEEKQEHDDIREERQQPSPSPTKENLSKMDEPIMKIPLVSIQSEPFMLEAFIEKKPLSVLTSNIDCDNQKMGFAIPMSPITTPLTPVIATAMTA